MRGHMNDDLRIEVDFLAKRIVIFLFVIIICRETILLNELISLRTF